jgi:hypothetical protein
MCDNEYTSRFDDDARLASRHERARRHDDPGTDLLDACRGSAGLWT